MAEGHKCTKRMLTSLLKTMSDMNVDGKTSGDGDEDISDLEDNADGKLQLGETPSLFRSNSNAYDSNSWSNRNSGLAQPSFNQSYRPTPEQSKMKTLVRDLVGTTHDEPDFSQTEGGQPLSDAASLNSSKVVPKGSDDEAEQVRFEIQIGRQTNSVAESKVDFSNSCYWRNTVKSTPLTSHSSASHTN